MFGFYPSPYIVIVMLAAAGVSLSLLFWLSTRSSWITSSLRIWPVAVVPTALFLLLASSGPLLKVFGQETPPVVGAWTFATVIEPTTLETGSEEGATVALTATFTVSSGTPTSLSISATSDSPAAQAIMELNTDSGRIGFAKSLSSDPYLYEPGGSLPNPSCDPDLEPGDDGEIKTTCTFDFLKATGTKLFAQSSATPGPYTVSIGFPQAVTFEATANTADNPEFTAGTITTSETGFSDPELPLTVILGRPSNLTATPGDGQLTLGWDDPGNANIDGYEYRQSSDGGGNRDPDWAEIAGSSATTTGHEVSGLSNGTEYTFEIRAIDANYEGAAASVTATPKTAPDNPENFRATVATGAVTLTWEAPVSNGGSAISNYEYRQSADGGSNWSPDWTDVAGSADTTSKTISGLTDDTAYTFHVRAAYSEGGGEYAALQATPPGGAVVTGPDAPRNLTSTVSELQATLGWSAPDSDGGEAITGYEYRQSIDRGATWDPPGWTETSGATVHTVTGLTNGTHYTFGVRAVNRVGVGNSLQVTATPGLDFDQDDDGLIDVATLAQLNAIRWDLDGNGSPTDLAYRAAFVNARSGMGCPDTGCTGYELTADLEFDTDGSGSADSGDEDWNDEAGWDPIGDGTNNFSATFHGNGHTISNLYISRPTTAYVGLFGYTDSSARVQNVGIVDISVTGGSDVGGLVGENAGNIRESYSTGSISGEANSIRVGGLVGYNRGRVVVSYSTSSVSGGSETGGLVGQNKGNVIASYATGAVAGVAGGTGTGVGGLVGFHSLGTIIASYSTGQVTGTTGAGGLVGASQATVTDSYRDTATSGQSTSSEGTGKTTSELQAPLDYTDIYANWNVDVDNEDGDDLFLTGEDEPWDFDTATSYPLLPRIHRKGECRGGLNG